MATVYSMPRPSALSINLIVSFSATTTSLCLLHTYHFAGSLHKIERRTILPRSSIIRNITTRTRPRFLFFPMLEPLFITAMFYVYVRMCVTFSLKYIRDIGNKAAGNT